MRAVLLAIVLAGCTKDPTQIVVRVDSDLGAQLTPIRAIVRDDQGGISAEHMFPAEVPFSFGVAPKEGPLDQMVIIELESAVSRRAVTRFVPDKTLLLPMFLAKSCIGVSCKEGETCTERGCESDEVTGLSEIEPGDEARFDAGVAPPDQGEIKIGRAHV